MLKPSLLSFLFLLFVVNFTFSQTARDYDWKNVPIGGGGYITGMKIHPMDANMRIYRTDVGGAYRYDAATGRMVQLIHSTEESHYSVAGIALHPTNTKIIYLAVGRKCLASSSAIYESKDGGKSFKKLSISGDNDFYFSGNGGRDCSGSSSDKDREGTPIAINPHNPNELYLGTTDKGLYILNLTTLRATQVPNNQIPHNTDRKSIRSVVFHPTSKLVYIGYAGRGIYMGNTVTQQYKLINSWTAAKDVIDISISKNANYLVVACKKKGLLKCSNIISGTSWSALTNGLNPRDTGISGYLTVDCSPHDNNKIITVVAGWAHINEFYVSTNAGDRWTRVNGNLPSANNSFPWRNVFGSHIAQIAYDPTDERKMHFTSWFSTFQCDNFSFANGGTWGNLESKGHEEIVPTDLLCFPTNSKGNFFITGSADHSGFIYDSDIDDINSFADEDLGKKTSDNLGKLKKSASYAFCEKQSDHLALVLTDEWTPNEGGLLTSSDGGDSWNLKPGYQKSDRKSVVEISSNNPDNIVIYGHNGLKYSLDGGETNFIPARGSWVRQPTCTLPFDVKCLGPTDVNSGHFNSSVFNVYRNIAADKELPCVFYYYDWDGSFSISTNGGKDWCIVHNDVSKLPANGSNGNFNVWSKTRMFTVPGKAGHIWINVNERLYFSNDAGASWNNISSSSAIHRAKSISFGKGLNDNYSAIYVYGNTDRDATDYYYRSDDIGKTWLRINNHSENELWTESKLIAGDRNIPGRLYSAVSGQGVVYGNDVVVIDDEEPTDDRGCENEELVANGQFDQPNGEISEFKLHEGALTSANGSINNIGEAHIAIKNGGTFDYDVQLWQDDLTLVGGQSYVLTTVARAQAPRSIVIKLRNKYNGSILYHEAELNLTQKHKVFTHQFVAPNDDNDIRLTHLVGSSESDVYFDLISLKKMSGADADADGICDTEDQCPNFNNNLIGQPCSDGNACTINDVYTADCGCRGDYLDADGDGVCDTEDLCPKFDDSLIGQPCNDGNACTSNDIYTTNCDCIGRYVDADGDGICAPNDSDDTDPCVPDDSGCNDCIIIDANDIESRWGIWNDGGIDAVRLNDPTYANSGTYSFRLRDNTAGSTVTTNSLDLSYYTSVEISFNYLPVSMDNTNEDFWLQISTDGGESFNTIEEWNYNDEFVNNVREFENVLIQGPFTTETQFRFRCDASSNYDLVYLDDITIKACSNNKPCANEDTNDAESGWGIWNDDGADASRHYDPALAHSGNYSFSLKDDTEESSITTNSLDLINYEAIKITFNYLPVSMDSPDEDFWLQMSTDGGTRFNTIEEWNFNDEFVNDVREFEQVIIRGPFSRQTQFRFRCDASGEHDFVYIDDIVIDGCTYESLDSEQKIKARTSERSIANTAPTDFEIPTLSEVKLDYNLYPNPVSSDATLYLNIQSKFENLDVQIIDLYGRVMLSDKVEQNQYTDYTIDTRQLAQGSYLIRVGNGVASKTKKIVVFR